MCKVVKFGNIFFMSLKMIMTSWRQPRIFFVWPLKVGSGKGRRYRTLHSYKLFWAVYHLFPQIWRTLNIQSRETIGQEDHVICLKTRPRRNSSPGSLNHLQDGIFYKYVVFKHPLSLWPNFFAAATHSSQRESTGESSNTMNGPRRHSYTRTMGRFPVSEKLPVSNHRKRTF